MARTSSARARPRSIVRDPVVTLVSLPRFLAPGDDARIGVVVNNLEGEPGDYRLTLSATGAGAFATPIDRSDPARDGQNFSDGFAAVGDNDRQYRAQPRTDRPRRSAHRPRLHGRRAAGAILSAAALCRPAGAGPVGHARRQRGGCVPARHRRGVPDRQPASRTGTSPGCCGRSTAMPMAASNRRRAAPCRCSMSMRWPAVADRPRFFAGRNGRSGDRPCRRIAARRRQFRRVERHRRHRSVARCLCHRLPDPRQGARPGRAGFRDQGGARLAARLRPPGPYEARRSCRRWPMRITCWRAAGRAMSRPCAISAIRSSRTLPTQLAQAQLGAALAQAGDVTRANAAYAAALGPPPRRPAGLRYVDYGSELRDSAAVLAFAAGNPGRTPRLTEVMDRVAELFARADRTSTQEQAWLLMAAEAAVRESGGDDDDGDRRRGAAEPAPSRSICAASSAAAPRRSRSPIAARRRRGGPCRSPACPRPICRPRARATACPARSFGRDGTPADLSQGAAKRAVRRGHQGQPRRCRPRRPHAGRRSAAGRVRDRERDPGAGGGSTPGYAWLKSTTETAYTEARDDRYRQRARSRRRRQGFHAGLCRARRHAGRVRLPRACRRGHVRSGDLGRTAIGRLAVSPK